MPEWSQQNVHKHMHVYSSDNEDLGHVEEVYEDSFMIAKGLIFHKERYIPYSTIASVDDDRVQLILSAEVAKEREWDRRPDYENHLGDPTQILYDRGHGVHDPFEETNTDTERA
jgi:hypothetical protein